MELPNQLNEGVGYDKLLAKCEEFKKQHQNLIIERSECLSEHETLMERLTAVQEEQKIAREQQFLLQQKLEDSRKTCAYNENDDHLQSLCLLLGYRMSKCQLLENDGLQITLYYRDICYVTYSETNQTFDLIEIFPQYFDFTKIRQFLQTTQDLRGLLACLRKFFDLALELKKKDGQT